MILIILVWSLMIELVCTLQQFGLCHSLSLFIFSTVFGYLQGMALVGIGMPILDEKIILTNFVLRPSFFFFNISLLKKKRWYLLIEKKLLWNTVLVSKYRSGWIFLPFYVEWNISFPRWFDEYLGWVSGRDWGGLVCGVKE